MLYVILKILIFQCFSISIFSKNAHLRYADERFLLFYDDLSDILHPKSAFIFQILHHSSFCRSLFRFISKKDLLLYKNLIPHFNKKNATIFPYRWHKILYSL
jgi:hypothetical protein